MVRHDAKANRQNLTSERIRVALGLLTPEERRARQEAERRRQANQALESAKGVPLFGGDE